MKNLISLLATSAITTVALLAINKCTGVLCGPVGPQGMPGPKGDVGLDDKSKRTLVSNTPDKWNMTKEDEDFVEAHKEHLEKIGFWKGSF